MLQVWNIYLHLPQKWPRFVGKYSSTMEHLGMGKPRYFGSSLHRPRSRLGIGCQLGQTSQLRGPNKSYWGLNGFNLWNVFFFILFPWRMEHDGHTCIYLLYIYIFTIYIHIYIHVPIGFHMSGHGKFMPDHQPIRFFLVDDGTSCSHFWITGKSAGGPDRFHPTSLG